MTGEDISYKGYRALVEFDPRDQIFVGRVGGIRERISFHGATIAELTADFHAAVDGYLDDCKTTGQVPEPPPAGDGPVIIS